jgi:DMSO/TMAO reductase YedYZ molybdopterin-dependent catalytic subunit
MDSRRLPPGQVLTDKWPVLTYGETPRVDTATWSVRVFGHVEEEVSFSWAELLALPRHEVACDMHCVTRWSRLENLFEGVPVHEVLRRARPRPGAVAVMAHTVEGYTTNVALDELVTGDALLALRHDGRDLEPEHGGPCRLLVPHLYLWKSAKWVNGLEVMDLDAPGFWERNGYHMRGDPWTEERYSDQETDAMQRMRAEAARRRGGAR